MIKKFRVQDFKSVESAEIELGIVNVFIGANGSGKSNLLEAVAVLAAAAFGRLDPESLIRRGCRPTGHFRPLFPHTRNDAETTASAEWENGAYRVTLASPAPERAIGWEFRREIFEQGGQVLVDRAATQGDPQAGLAALRLAEMPADSDPARFLKTLAGYSIYTPNTPTLQSSMQDPQLREPVGLSGGRLAEAVGELLQKQDAEELLMERLTNAIEWFGGFGLVKLTPLDQQLPPKRVLAFSDRFLRTDEADGTSNFLSAKEVNEGTLYWLMAAVLCLHSASPKFFALENADHGLNPILARNLMRAVCDWLFAGKNGRQVLLTTHNPLALDGLPLEDDRARLFTVDRDNRGASVIRRFVITDQHRAKAKEGWPLSRMWVNGLIGGVANV